jgi:hypothetical protein
MKTIISSLVLILSIVSVSEISAQTTYNINSNATYSGAGIPNNCSNCIINIANGVTLTVDKDVTLQNVSFKGGTSTKSTIVVNDKKVNFSAPGSFNNVMVNFNKADLTNSAAITITNSTFTFTKTAVATANASVSLVSSNWRFEDNSVLDVTAGVFSIKAGSLTIGDGSPSSKASATFDGGSLSLLDATSFVTMATGKNDYNSANPFNGNGTLISTLSSLSGPSSLTAAGVTSSAILPIKLQSFAAKTNGNTVVLEWITLQEINSNVFEIERSIDGVNYVKVGSVGAKGNSPVISKYSYTEVVKGGSSYAYRLKMVDADNQSEYSPIVKVSFNNNANVASVKTYPNPATNFFAIDGATGTMQVQLVNMQGAVVKTISGYIANAKVSLDGIVAGNYVVKVSGANNMSQSFKMIVAR